MGARESRLLPSAPLTNGFALGLEFVARTGAWISWVISVDSSVAASERPPVLALGEIEMECGKTSVGRNHLTALETHATAQGSPSSPAKPTLPLCARNRKPPAYASAVGTSSNSAIATMIWNIRRPDGVERSSDQKRNWWTKFDVMFACLEWHTGGVGSTICYAGIGTSGVGGDLNPGAARLWNFRLAGSNSISHPMLSRIYSFDAQ